MIYLSYFKAGFFSPQKPIHRRKILIELLEYINRKTLLNYEMCSSEYDKETGILLGKKKSS